MTDHTPEADTDLIRRILNAAASHQVAAAITLPDTADLTLQSLVHLHAPRLIDALAAVRQLAAEAAGPIDPAVLQATLARTLTAQYTPGGPALRFSAALADPGLWAALLSDDCPRCGGCGVIQAEAWRAWWEEDDKLREAWKAANPGGDWHGSAEGTNHDFETPDGDEEVQCPQCRGAGAVPTAVGNVLLRLARQHLR